MMAVEREVLRDSEENLASRGRTLSAAKQLPPIDQELSTLSNALTRARSGVVQELVQVFEILVEVGGRPSICRR